MLLTKHPGVCICSFSGGWAGKEFTTTDRNNGITRNIPREQRLSKSVKTERK